MFIVPVTGLLFAAYAAIGIDAPQTGDAPGEPPAAAARLLGAASCSASTCHGGSGPQGTRFSEYTTWIAHDPHAHAYETLHHDRSVRIAQHLGLTSAHDATLCLSCHAQATSEATGFRKEAGVACESCH